jgi:hypothetical protein
MAITPATAYGTQMTKLTGNTGGAVQQLIESYLNTNEKVFIETVTYASQVAGTVIAVARIPVPFVPVAFNLLTDTSSGSTTLALGNSANGNSAKYKAAAAFTTTDVPTSVGLTSALGVPVLSGVDSQGQPTTYGAAQNGGGGYEDVTLTLAAATAPASGTLRIFTRYLTP